MFKKNKTPTRKTREAQRKRKWKHPGSKDCRYPDPQIKRMQNKEPQKKQRFEKSTRRTMVEADLRRRRRGEQRASASAAAAAAAAASSSSSSSSTSSSSMRRGRRKESRDTLLCVIPNGRSQVSHLRAHFRLSEKKRCEDSRH